ncbi:AraC family transcriptional regulator [Opitutales bacterium ASA1]|uniref:AraC family transcriptional regulator n=1 Tax=Congregicoccus parvus TaxID=3081749 RepID=UPI002B2E3B44|nr:AraC family transcriptional regulator [Opitutales bacterium ASA1]
MNATSARLGERDAWAERLRAGQFRQLLDLVPHTLFFAKDLEGRLTFANTAFVQRCGYDSEEEIVGLRDEDIFPPALAERYRDGDRRVIATGKPVLGIIELFPDVLGEPDWCETNKLPLFDSRGRVCGVYGTVRSYEGARAAIQPYLDLAPSADYLKTHYADRLDIEKLASLSGMSVRQFERRFNQTFRMNPRTYLVRVRVAIGAELLRTTSRRTTEIALEVGFYDHSDFSRQFRRVMGVSPTDYRRQRSKDGA